MTMAKRKKPKDSAVADFSLFDRLRGYNDLGEKTTDVDGEQQIPIHLFYGSIMYVVLGSKTRQQIIDAFKIQPGTQENQLNAFFNGYDQAADKNWYSNGVHWLFMTAQRGDEATFPEQLVIDTWQLTKDVPPANSVN